MTPFIACLLALQVVASTTFEMSMANQRGISISNINGKVDITIDGEHVDLNKGKVIKETDTYKTIVPAENPNYTITMCKPSGIIVRAKDGSSFSSVGNIPKGCGNEVNDKVQDYLNQKFQNIFHDTAQNVAA